MIRLIVAVLFLASVVAATYYMARQYRVMGNGNFLPPPEIKPRPRDPAPADPKFTP